MEGAMEGMGGRRRINEDLMNVTAVMHIAQLVAQDRPPAHGARALAHDAVAPFVVL